MEFGFYCEATINLSSLLCDDDWQPVADGSLDPLWFWCQVSGKFDFETVK